MELSADFLSLGRGSVKLSSSHFLTSEIFIKISSLESLTTYHPENRKNIPTVSEFNEIFLRSLDFVRQIQRRSPFCHPRSREFFKLP